LGSGRLIKSGAGFREYQIEFSIRPVPLPALTGYLERLLESPQALRIDRIDMRRDPERTEFAANLVITRTVVDRPGGRASTPMATTGWTCEGCEAGIEDRSGQEPVVVLRGTEAGGTAFLERSLSSAGVFDVVLEMASAAEGQLGVVANGAVLSCDGDIALNADNRFYRYRFKFALPEVGANDRAASVLDVDTAACGVAHPTDSGDSRERGCPWRLGSNTSPSPYRRLSPPE
jgi:hypothetical protein